MKFSDFLVPVAFARADIRARYRGSKLGSWWFILNPLLQTGLFTFFLSLIAGSLDLRFPVYVATGVVLWEVITSSIINGCGAFIYAEGYLKNFKINYDLYLVRVPVVVLVNYIFNSLVLVLMVLLFNPDALLLLILTIIGLLPFIFILSYSLARLFSHLMLLFRDLSQVMNHILQIIWYVSPIFIWKGFFVGSFAWLYTYNPITYYLDILRNPAISNEPPSINSIIIVSIIIIILFSFSEFIARKMRSNLIFRI